jgi:hypothetical protein
MQKKASVKPQYELLGARVSSALDVVNKLCETTPTPAYSAAPDPNILKNLLGECEDSDYWQNFKKAAPILFCMIAEEDANLKQMRDISFIEELLKVKSILSLLDSKLQDGSADIDLVEYSIATKMLEHKLSILTSLNMQVEGESEGTFSFNLYGTNKSIKIDKAKFMESVTIQDQPVVEKEATAEAKLNLKNIPMEGVSEEDYVKQSIEAIGEVKKSGKILEKETFVKIFKYTGDFAKFKNQEIKKKAQDERCKNFQKDAAEYLKALKSNIAEEEKSYEASSRIMFDALSITPELFERTQQTMMNDPYVSMELFNMGISMEQPQGSAPKELTAEKTVELVKASNDFAFDEFKKEYISQISADPMMMPVLISAIAHDWVKVNHGFPEEQFKAALFEHKIYENPEVSEHMQTKQMELLSLAA